jgi:hypothetical protein
MFPLKSIYTQKAVIYKQPFCLKNIAAGSTRQKIRQHAARAGRKFVMHALTGEPS